jgi:DMSO/TMAO reductase YedYZ molybdopterin-dependent catalytic subunit
MIIAQTFLWKKREPDVLLVHTVEDKPLTREHGGPVRMITPNCMHGKVRNGICRIEFLTANKRGFWEERVIRTPLIRGEMTVIAEEVKVNGEWSMVNRRGLLNGELFFKKLLEFSPLTHSPFTRMSLDLSQECHSQNLC